MSVGKYIQMILKQKNISLTKLSKEINLKSRNTLYRLFSGYHSYETEKELISKIIGAVNFSEEEISIIYKLLDKGKEGKYAFKVIETLLNIYDSKAGGFKTGKTDLISLLSKYISDKKSQITIAFSGIKDADIIYDIYEVLKMYRRKVKIYNYLQFPFRDELAICEVLALIRLSEFENYIPLRADKSVKNMIPGLNIYIKNSMGCYLQKLEFVNDKIMLIETCIPEKLYAYEVRKHENISSCCERLKFPVKKVADYMKVLSDIKELDSNNGFFSEGAPCFGYLTGEILCEMFKDINYFGFPEDHPYVVNLMKTVKEKDNIRYKEGVRKRMLFDVSILAKMMKTGISVDHAEEFLPMTTQQRKKYFNFIIDLAKNNPNLLQIRILKDASMDCSYVYVEGHMLYIYRSKTGYTNGSSVIVKDSGVIDIMNIFTEYVWENCTLSDSESMKVLEKLMTKYLYEEKEAEYEDTDTSADSVYIQQADA
ncbi:MAG: hypothetical protein LUH47_01055 [Clostridiales bacterium]|nr:hypothetical protein [Clostridiales bacterium]